MEWREPSHVEDERVARSCTAQAKAARLSLGDIVTTSMTATVVGGFTGLQVYDQVQKSQTIIGSQHIGGPGGVCFQSHGRMTNADAAIVGTGAGLAAGAGVGFAIALVFAYLKKKMLEEERQ